MANARGKSTMAKILDNVLFLAEVFGDKPDRDIPDLPVLELAQCFDLVPPTANRGSRHGAKASPLWK